MLSHPSYFGRERMPHTHTHTHFKYNAKTFLICIFLQISAGCTLDEPLHTLACPEKSSISDQFLGVIHQSIYEPDFHIPDGYTADYHGLSKEYQKKRFAPLQKIHKHVTTITAFSSKTLLPMNAVV